MDPHFVWPWVHWTHCIDLCQAGSNFSYQYLNSLVSSWPHSSKDPHTPFGRYYCHRFEEIFYESFSKNHSFSQKVIWEKETSQEQHIDFHCHKPNVAKLKWFHDYWPVATLHECAPSCKDIQHLPQNKKSTWDMCSASSLNSRKNWFAFTHKNKITPKVTIECTFWPVVLGLIRMVTMMSMIYQWRALQGEEPGWSHYGLLSFIRKNDSQSCAKLNHQTNSTQWNFHGMS